MPQVRQGQNQKYKRPTPAQEEVRFNIIYKLEIVLSGNIDNLKARVQYKPVPNDNNKCGFSLRRTDRMEIREALEEWKKEYRYKIQKLKPLNVSDIITKKGYTNPIHIAKLNSYVTIINAWIDTNQSSSRIPLNDNQQILNTAPQSNAYPSAPNQATLQQLQSQTDVQIQQLQNLIQQQQHTMEIMKQQMAEMRNKEMNRRSQVSYLRKEKEKKKVWLSLFVCT